MNTTSSTRSSVVKWVSHITWAAFCAFSVYIIMNYPDINGRWEWAYFTIMVIYMVLYGTGSLIWGLVDYSFNKAIEQGSDNDIPKENLAIAHAQHIVENKKPLTWLLMKLDPLLICVVGYTALVLGSPVMMVLYLVSYAVMRHYRGQFLRVTKHCFDEVVGEIKNEQS